ncbi:MAG TPA: PfkB family carbohydrate kinase [Byssovorax sp.]|jgi:sugar/nucleoside kinase (ribokinase family)
MPTAVPVLIVGSMAFDDLELPTGAEADVVGGSATYASFAASSLTTPRVVAVVGDDFPAATLEAMRARGIDTEGVERASGKTFRWAGRYDQDLVHRTTLKTELNVFANFQPKIPESYRATPIVMLGNIHPALQLDVLEQARAPKFVIADTMNFWIEGERATVDKLLRRIDTLVVNDEEARLLSGLYNIRHAAIDILKRGPKRLIIKRGEHGALLFDEAGVFAAPGFPLESVVDPTGAGDSFAGGLVGYLARQPVIDAVALRRAMIHATATASFCVEAVGTRKIAQITRADIAARVGDIRALYDYGADSMATLD